MTAGFRLSVALLVLATSQSSQGQIAPGYSSGPVAPPAVNTGPFASQQTVHPLPHPGHVIEAAPIVSRQPSCDRFWEHRSSLSVDFLFLTARDVDIPYATHVDGPVPDAAAISPPVFIDPDHEPGFRVTAALAPCDRESFSASFWLFNSTVDTGLTLPANTGWIRSEVTHPTTAPIATDSLFARARHDIDFQMADLMYKGLLGGDCSTAVNLQFGVRYGHLNQEFRGEYSISGLTLVDTEIDYHGIGPRLGMTGERLLNDGFVVYGEAFVSCLFGRIDADYAQQNAAAGLQAATALDDDFRAVPQLEAELGLGWQSSNGRLRLRAGYYVGTWFNVARTQTWIETVRAGTALDISETLLFDGLTARAELRF